MSESEIKAVEETQEKVTLFGSIKKGVDDWKTAKAAEKEAAKKAEQAKPKRSPLKWCKDHAEILAGAAGFAAGAAAGRQYALSQFGDDFEDSEGYSETLAVEQSDEPAETE